MLAITNEIIAIIRFISIHKESFLGLYLGSKPNVLRSLFIIIIPNKKNDEKTTKNDTILQIQSIHHIMICFIRKT
jgi:hypothetical protein